MCSFGHPLPFHHEPAEGKTLTHTRQWLMLLVAACTASTGYNSTFGPQQRRSCPSLCLLQCSQSIGSLLHLPFSQRGQSLFSSSPSPIGANWSQDQAFLQDSQLALLQALASSSQQMRVQASWALANLSDALTVSGFKLPSSSYRHILSAASKALKDKDMVFDLQDM